MISNYRASDGWLTVIIGEKFQLDRLDLSVALSWNLFAKVGEKLKIPYIRCIGRHPVNTNP
jgi:hypothetical protein